MAAAALHMISLLAAMQFPRLSGMFHWEKVGVGGKGAHTNYTEDTFYIKVYKPHLLCNGNMLKYLCIFIHLSLNQTKLI